MNNIEIYTLSRCPFCIKAKELLGKHGLGFIEHEISHDEENMRQKLKEKFNLPDKATVPQIIINGKYVGGYSDLKELFNSGKIKNFLK